MKLALLATVFFVLCVAGAAAQTPGEIVISGVSPTNCLQGSNLNGFNALSWTLGGTDAVTFGGGGGTSGRVALADLTLARNVDVCSESLIKNFLVGQSFPTLTLTQYEAGAAGGPSVYAYMVVTLSNAVVNNYSVGGSNSTEPGETVSFGYSKLCVQTTGLNPSGTLKPPVSVCYNLATNVTN
jgi:type VI protein secretion system component Hcp